MSLKTFDEIYTENYAKLHRVAVKMVCDKENASDIVQEVFMSLYNKFSDGKEVVYVSTWLYRATLNKCIDCLQRQKKFSTIEDLKENSFDVSVEDCSLEDKEKEAMIRLALSKLKPKEQALLILYSEGFSYKDISEATGIWFSSVGKMLARTLEKMENQLKAQHYEMY